jgi:phosphatidylinositol glycan class W
MLVVTCAAILAVDFRVFPRRFAKVENWGTSLMDIGVGSFVFSAGLVSARSILKQPSTKADIPFSSRMKIALRSSIPLLVLGLVRLALVKGVDYAEHVTEYGVHWNFFFTLGFLPPFVAALQSISVGKNSNPTYVYTALSITIASIYQAVLVSTPLQEYVLIGDRHKFGLLGMNKEGASSFFGYLAIFLSGTATGTYVLPRNKNSLLWSLAAWSAFWCILFMITSEPWGLSIGVSRRLANLSYVLWIAAFNTAQIAAFYLVEVLFFPRAATAEKQEEAYNKAVPKILEAYNRNGLALFLVANVLTGLVNLSVDTLGAGRVEAMAILGAYMGIITIVAVALQSRGVVIKL